MLEWIKQVMICFVKGHTWSEPEEDFPYDSYCTRCGKSSW